MATVEDSATAPRAADSCVAAGTRRTDHAPAAKLGPDRVRSLMNAASRYSCQLGSNRVGMKAARSVSGCRFPATTG